jgi:hypothetical protein
MIIPVNDPFYLASKIMELREDKDKAQMLSNENWTVAHERHDYKRITKQLEEIYSTLSFEL